MARYKSRVSFDKTTKLLRRLPEDVTAEVRQTVDELGTQVLAQAIALAPIETGALKAALRKRLSRDKLRADVGILGRIAKRVFYAHWVEFGTRPHDISRGARAGRGGKKARAGEGKPVHHPGAKAKPFLVPALEALRNGGIQKMGDAIRRALETASKGV